MRFHRGLTLFAFSVLFITSRNSFAWPLFVKFGSVTTFAGKPKGAFVALAFSEGRWRRIPLQVDQMSASGDRLQWDPEFEHSRRREFYGGVAPFHPTFRTDDEIVLDNKSFEPCDESCRAHLGDGVREICRERGDAPGVHPRVVEVRLENPPRSAFVAACSRSQPPMPAAVRWNQTEHYLDSDGYRYTYNADNSLLLDQFALRERSGELIKLLETSSFTLHAKPKFFFPMTFTGNDITSELMSFSSHPVSSTGELSFQLRVLLFKIRMDLLSAISMYRDAIEVPAVLTLPVSGSLLREGSGVLYGFRFAGKGFREAVRTDMPWLPPPGSPIEFRSMRTFSLVQGDTAVVAVVRMPKSFKRMGFSPALATATELGTWDFPQDGSDFGIFYDITKLRKGRHRLEVWFLTGKASERETMEEIAVSGFHPTFFTHSLDERCLSDGVGSVEQGKKKPD